MYLHKGFAGYLLRIVGLIVIILILVLTQLQTAHAQDKSITPKNSYNYCGLCAAYVKSVENNLGRPFPSVEYAYQLVTALANTSGWYRDVAPPSVGEVIVFQRGVDGVNNQTGHTAIVTGTSYVGPGDIWHIYLADGCDNWNPTIHVLGSGVTFWSY